MSHRQTKLKLKPKQWFSIPLFISLFALALMAGWFAYAQDDLPALLPGKSPDFDNNGIVGYSDFFLFADNFAQATAPANEQFDLNNDNQINLDDFFIFADYFGRRVDIAPAVSSLCKEVFPGRNNANDRNKINIVFVGINNNINSFTEAAATYSQVFNEKEPFKSNFGKFDFWYANQIEYIDQGEFPTNGQDDTLLRSKLREKGQNLAANCELPNRYVIILVNTHFQSYTDNFDKNIIAIAQSATSEPDLVRNVIMHEFGHSFGQLLDEYIANNAPVSDNKNCGKVTETTACSLWCRGAPRKLEDLKSSCLGFNENRCRQDNTCLWKADERVCDNIINYCGQFTDRHSCSFSDIRYGCTYSTSQNFFGKSCFPLSDLETSISIGTDCIKDTVCINGCNSWRGFRSTYSSIMLTGSGNFGYVNTLILCSQIKMLTGNYGGICNTLDHIYIPALGDSKEKIIEKNELFVRDNTKKITAAAPHLSLEAQVFGEGFSRLYLNYRYNDSQNITRVVMTQQDNKFVGEMPIPSSANEIFYYYSATINNAAHRYPTSDEFETTIYRGSIIEWKPDKIIRARFPDGTLASNFTLWRGDSGNRLDYYYDEELSHSVHLKISPAFGSSITAKEIEIDYEESGRQRTIKIFLPNLENSFESVYIADDGSTFWASHNNILNQTFEDAIQKMDLARLAPSS